MTEPLKLRAGSGLGDSLYLQSVSRHYIKQGQPVLAASDWPDVFEPLKATGLLTLTRFQRLGFRSAHYSTRRFEKGTTQFQDCCISAGIANYRSVELRLDWQLTDHWALWELEDRSQGRPIIVVQLPRAPMNRVDGYGLELLPDGRAIQQIIDALRDYALLVQVGSGDPLYRLERVEVDLTNKTTVKELIDIVGIADACLGYVSFIVPLAESLNLPLLTIWSVRGFASKTPLIRTITPEKILTPGKRHLHIQDNASPGALASEAAALLREAGKGSGGAVHQPGTADSTVSG